MTETKAMKALATKLAGRGAQTWLAHTLKIQQGTVSRWVAGAARPEAHLRVALELLFKIPQPDWMTDDEVELLERVRELVKAEAAKAYEALAVPHHHEGSSSVARSRRARASTGERDRGSTARGVGASVAQGNGGDSTVCR